MIPCFINFFEGGKSRSRTKHKYKLLPDLALQGAILKIIGKAIFCYKMHFPKKKLHVLALDQVVVNI